MRAQAEREKHDAEPCAFRRSEACSRLTDTAQRVRAVPKAIALPPPATKCVRLALRGLHRSRAFTMIRSI